MVQGFMAAQHELPGGKLDLIIHSTGGSLQAAEQIVSYVRQKYDHVRVIVPLFRHVGGNDDCRRGG